MALDDRINIPKELREIRILDEACYEAIISKIRFDGSTLLGSISFSKTVTHESGIVEVEYRFNTPEKTSDVLLRQGNPPNRMTGYRASIAGSLANMGYIVSERVLASVFRPLDDKLLDVYRKVFPKDAEDLVTFSGVVNEIVSPSEKMSWRHTNNLYVLVSKEGVCRVGLENTEEPKWPIQEGDLLEVTYNRRIGVAARVIDAVLEFPGGALSYPEVQVWQSLVSYRKQDNDQKESSIER